MKLYSLLFSLLFYSFGYAQITERSFLEVYDNVEQAIGNTSVDLNDPLISGARESGAQFNYKLRRIEIEKDVLSICAAFGKDSLNALAFIIGHELGHAYNRHDWLIGFKSAFAASTDYGKELRKTKVKMDTLIVHESQADEFGCYFATAAGYDVTGITSRLLDTIYTVYGLKEKIKGYPTLTQRKAIADTAEAKMQAYAHLFKFSNLQFAQGNYEMALSGYEHILSKFPSREIYNNAGVCRANMALQLLPEDSIKLIVPFEIDYKTRLNENTERGLSADDQFLIDRLFKKAKHNFEAAVKLDPDYRAGYLNLAMVSYFTGDDIGQNSNLERGRRLSKSESERAIYLNVKGVLEALAGSSIEAEKSFKESSKLGNTVAELNYGLLNGDKLKYSKSTMEKVVLRPVDNVRLQGLMFEKGYKIIDFDLAEGDYELMLKELPNSNVLYGRLRFKKAQQYSLQTVDSEKHKMNGVSKNEIFQKYGSPSASFEMGRYSYLVYKRDRVIFEYVDEDLLNVITYFNM